LGPRAPGGEGESVPRIKGQEPTAISIQFTSGRTWNIARAKMRILVRPSRSVAILFARRKRGTASEKITVSAASEGDGRVLRVLRGCESRGGSNAILEYSVAILASGPTGPGCSRSVFLIDDQSVDRLNCRFDHDISSLRIRFSMMIVCFGEIICRSCGETCVLDPR